MRRKDLETIEDWALRCLAQSRLEKAQAGLILILEPLLELLPEYSEAGRKELLGKIYNCPSIAESLEQLHSRLTQWTHDCPALCSAIMRVAARFVFVSP